MRGGRTMKMSIFDIVVGDVVPLKIGDQVRFISEEIIFYDAFKSFKLTIQILRCFT
jgi:allophanate hydrolase subunit 1